LSVTGTNVVATFNEVARIAMATLDRSMSRFEALSRLITGDRRSDMFSSALRFSGTATLLAAIHLGRQPATVTIYTMTPERMAASAGALTALIAAVIGGMALSRATGRMGKGNGQRGAIVALVLGPVGAVIGALVVATADGGLGTGNGLGGGVVAIIVGLIGMALGRLALARSRRTA
jgi:hypothetical protein